MNLTRREFLQAAAPVGLLILFGQSPAHDFEHTAVLAHGCPIGWDIGGWHIGKTPGPDGWHIGRTPEPDHAYLPLVRG